MLVVTAAFKIESSCYITDKTVCKTMHMFNTETSRSSAVEKRCVEPKLCTADHIGCTTSDDGISKVSEFKSTLG